MNDKQIIAIVAIVGAYYYWHMKGKTPMSRNPTSSTPRGVSTVGSKASTSPTTSRQVPTTSSATAGGGKSYAAAPVRSVGQLNKPQRSAAGTGIKRAIKSSTWGGTGTVGISPTWPSTQVTSTKTIKTGSGRVQVPSYTSVPVITQGPGGAGTIINFGS